MAASLMGALAAGGDLDGARSVYDALEFPGDGPGARRARAVAVGAMADILSDGDQPVRAARLVCSRRFRDECSGFRAIAARSYMGLAESFVRNGLLEGALELLDSGALEPADGDAPGAKALSACSAAVKACRGGDIRTAMRLLGEIPRIRTSRRAAFSRVLALLAMRDSCEAAGDAECQEFVRSCAADFSPMESRLYFRNVHRDAPAEEGA
jgi:hypothetical protein